ncbi:unnamed protein product [Meganyctiphanes norvegica]|uniref:RING-type domain-containing protein n=1 Tax=Meganyctiphanes norvegica TaxID=48144 RepID=A0AAV2QK59_MEGNR
MEDTECIVCFSRFDGEEHRPRALPCGHTICTDCLEKAIKALAKKCPKCRTVYSASNVKQIPINFNLESVMKLLSISKTSKGTDLPECAEHQIQVSHRCTSHKAWICQNCVREDHSSESCKIITVTEKLNFKKSRQLDQSKPMLDSFEEICTKVDDCKKQCKEQITDCDEDIVRLNKEIQKKKTSKLQLEEKFAILDEKLDNIKKKRSYYDQAVSSLNASENIKEVSQCSLRLQNEAEKLKLISLELEKELELMLQTVPLQDDELLGYPKLSVRNGRTHFHALQVNNIYKSSPSKIQCTDESVPLLTEGLITFLDIGWPGQEPRRVYIKMVGNNTARSRQHLLLVTSQCGPSYKGATFSSLARKGQPGEHLVISPYDGNNAAPLLQDVTVNDDRKHDVKAGLVSGGLFMGDANNAVFGVYLSDCPRAYDRTGFGEVTSGLEVLQDIAKSNIMHKMTVVDCGMVLSF